MTFQPEVDPATLKPAITAAASFLRERLRSGRYALACVGTDGTPRASDNKGHVFVASFMADAMAGLMDEIDRTIVLVRILSEENGGKWGFASPQSFHRDAYRVFHVDSDDTAYVLRCLRRLGANRDPECIMQFYRQPEQMFVTFDTPGPTTLTAKPSPQNNMLAHPEVNANVFLTLQGTHLEPFINIEMLLAAQDSRGYWPSYFYPSPLFGTVLALDVLRSDASAAAVTRALSYIAGSQNADGSWGAPADPYETALAVTALSRHPLYASAVQSGTTYLLSSIGSDGAWKSNASIYEFHFDDVDVWRGYDAHGAYVSARCLTALRRAAGEI